MSKINKDKLGYLGIDFQYRLLQQVLIDRKFGETIIDILSPNYFEDTFLRSVAGKIKDNYEKYEVIPDINSLESILFENIVDEVDKEMYISSLKRIKEAEQNNGLRTQDIALKFCKQQELKKAVREIQTIIEKGDLDSYYECEDKLKAALEVGNAKDDGIDVFDNIKDVLAEDFRDPIPTGIDGLDSYMDGGLAKGELAVILAPTGVGKTTMTTKIVNHAKNIGKNVLQIFFEDMPKNIQKKHLACWMGGKYTMNELGEHEDEVMSVADEMNARPGTIKLKKFPSDSTTIPMIKQYIKKLISQGFRPDIVILDYIECVQPSKQFKDSWEGEGNVMRQFETMLGELDIAGWTASQGNRSSITAETVDTSMFGGSIKKAQIGHFIVSIAKTLDQREAGTANMAILKSRFGQDGIVFEDIVFDNARIQISMSNENRAGNTFLESKENKAVRDQNRVNDIMAAIQARKEANNANNNN